ncbi:peptidoglycan bridge formation glycyltransferase FemA/FemB family protein [Candidatus Roizmanbacteria bacterium]|nr:peptidoglycan bridge formation glycyltransferase FemA/FemB family protein [Candidatus Roizmanbacteria bacterium]
MKYSIKEITDKKTWNTFIETVLPESYFQSWEWGEVEKASGKTVWRLGIYEQLRVKNNDQTTNKLIGISQIIKIQAKRGTFLHVRHGPILKDWNETVFRFWLAYLKQLAEKEHASFIRVSPLINLSYTVFLSAFSFQPAPIHNMDAEIVSVIDVRKSEEELLSHMRKNTRSLIRKGLKMGISVQKSSDTTAFLKLYGETVTRHDFVPHQAIEDELRIFSSDKKAELLISSYEKIPLAVAIVSYFGNQAIYRHGASVKTSIPAAYVLQWEIMKRTKRKGLPFYNLFGIADTDRPDHPWWGLTLFKKGFGGETKQYLHAHDLAITPAYWINYAVETVRRIKRGY